MDKEDADCVMSSIGGDRIETRKRDQTERHTIQK